MTSDVATGPPSRDRVQRALEEMRSQLLAGRGPGAGPVEVLQHTRARTRLAGEPVARLRQRVAHAAGAARGDVDRLALQVAEDRTRLDDSLAALVGSGPRRPSRRARTVAVVVAGVLLRAVGRRLRS